MERRGGTRDTREHLDERYERPFRREMRSERYKMIDWSSSSSMKRYQIDHIRERNER